MTVQKAVNAYKKVGLETKVAAATPEKLIDLLFDGAISAVNKGIVALQSGDVAALGQSTGKASAIIVEGLMGSLKIENNEIGRNLLQLYEYISTLLLKAGLERSEEKLVEARDLLADLSGAWKEATGKNKAAA